MNDKTMVQKMNLKKNPWRIPFCCHVLKGNVPRLKIRTGSCYLGETFTSTENIQSVYLRIDCEKCAGRSFREIYEYHQLHGSKTEFDHSPLSCYVQLSSKKAKDHEKSLTTPFGFLPEGLSKSHFPSERLAS